MQTNYSSVSSTINETGVLTATSSLAFLQENHFIVCSITNNAGTSGSIIIALGVVTAVLWVLLLGAVTALVFMYQKR